MGQFYKVIAVIYLLHALFLYKHALFAQKNRGY